MCVYSGWFRTLTRNTQFRPTKSSFLIPIDLLTLTCNNRSASFHLWIFDVGVIFIYFILWQDHRVQLTLDSLWGVLMPSNHLLVIRVVVVVVALLGRGVGGRNWDTMTSDLVLSRRSSWRSVGDPSLRRLSLLPRPNNRGVLEDIIRQSSSVKPPITRSSLQVDSSLTIFRRRVIYFRY